MEVQGDIPKAVADVTGQMQGTLPRVRAVIENSSEETLRGRPGGAALSPLEGIVSMFVLETEIVRPSITIIMQNEDTPLPSFHAEDRAGAQGYNSYHPAQLAQGWATIRSSTMALVSSITEQDLAKTGRHETLGEVTLESLLRAWMDLERRFLERVEDIAAS